MAGDEPRVSDEWKVQQRLQLLSRRFDFADYDAVGAFLDRLEDLSKQEEYYPDLTFSQTHVNVTIKARDGELADADFAFSVKVDALLEDAATQPQTG